MSPMRRYVLIGPAIVLVLLFAAAMFWLLQPGGGNRSAAPAGRLAVASNPALNLRFKYNTALFALAPFNSRAEFPLRLDARDDSAAAGFSFYGKRLGGLGQMLAKDPGPVLYDFTGQLSDAMFAESYGLLPGDPPRYEDAEIGGRLALHQMLQFKLDPANQWPGYFPAAVKLGTVVYIEGWTLITNDDLFFFYALSPIPLQDTQRAACEQVLNSLQFNAITSQSETNPPPAQKDAEPGASSAVPDSASSAPEGTENPGADEPAPAPETP